MLKSRRDALAELVVAGPHPGERVEELRAAHRQTLHQAEEARQLAEAAGAVVSADADRIRTQLVHAWHAQRGAAADAARVLWQGPGRFGLHRGAYGRAADQLTAWADGWRPLLAAMPTDPQRIAEIAGRSDYPLHPGEAFAAAGRARAEAAHPDHARLVAAAAAARAAVEAAGAALADARREDADRAARFGRLADTPDSAARLADTDRDLAATREELAAARDRIAALKAEPAYRNRPPDQPEDEPADWRTRTGLDRNGQRPTPKKPPAPDKGIRHPRPEDLGYLQPRPGPGRGISR